MSEQTQNETAPVEINSQIAERKGKLSALRAQGIAFPNDWRRDSLAADLHASHDGADGEALAAAAIKVSVAGRIMTRRIMGKASFVTLQDMSGRIQLYVTRDDLPENFYNEQFKKWDLGDIIGAEGTLFITKTGELSVHVTAIKLLTKALRPLPDKFHGLADQEQRYRQRYLDLIVNDESRRTFMVRSKVVSAIRDYLSGQGFLEVETPMMQTIPGGATARPFITHHNALDMQLYLRIAPELYLKRLVVGGFEKVFEINRNFRNEGLSTRHNPEFTMLEFYWGYADYQDLMNLTEDMLRSVCERVLGTTEVVYGEHHYDFGQPFVRMSLLDSILHFNPQFSRDQLATLEGASAVAAGLEIKVKAGWGLGKVQTEIFEATVEHRLIQPTFITAYPAEVSPLARRNDNDPFVTDRFEFFVGGREIANGFSELNDAEDQAERFAAQVQAKDAGDDEAMFFDEDYITALEHGLPPTAGEGIGIDRLVMLLTNSHSIRDVLLFPHMRPQAK